MTKETVAPEAISGAPIEAQTKPPTVGSDPLSGDPVFQQQLGKIGSLVGGGPEKAGNIAIIVIILAFLMVVAAGLGAAFAKNPDAVSFFDKMMTAGASLISGALGYIFGKSGKD